MGKSGKTKYVSAGKHCNVSKETRKGMKRELDGGVKFLNIMHAYWKGKNPWITVENPNKEETNKRFIKVKTNDHFGDPKKRQGYIQKANQK